MEGYYCISHYTNGIVWLTSKMSLQSATGAHKHSEVQKTVWHVVVHWSHSTFINSNFAQYHAVFMSKTQVRHYYCTIGISTRFVRNIIMDIGVHFFGSLYQLLIEMAGFFCGYTVNQDNYVTFI